MKREDKEVVELLIFTTLGFINIYLSIKILIPFIGLGAFPIGLLGFVFIYRFLVEKYRKMIPFQVENARNWALARGHNVCDYSQSWQIFTAAIPLAVMSIINYILFLAVV
jgi:hypothetical protein